MEITVVKMNQVLYVDIKAGEKKPKPKFLWALIDKFGHTVIQIYSEEYPTKFVKEFID
jgi:hypothetical protein